MAKVTRILAAAKGKAISVNKDQKRLAVLWGLVGMSGNEKDRQNDDMEGMRSSMHPVFGTCIEDYPVNATRAQVKAFQKGLPEGAVLHSELCKLVEPYVEAALKHDFMAKFDALA